jgi:hypothetical protein
MINSMFEFSLATFRLDIKSPLLTQLVGDIAVVVYGATDNGRVFRIRSNYEKIVRGWMSPADLRFVNTFFEGFGHWFLKCSDPESACKTIRDELRRMRDVIELTDGQLVLAPTIESALDYVDGHYLPFRAPPEVANDGSFPGGFEIENSLSVAHQFPGSFLSTKPLVN